MSDTTIDLIQRRLDTIESALADAGIRPAFNKSSPKAETWLTRRQQAERWGVSVRTVERRSKDQKLGLPPEMEINKRWFRALSKIEAWERARVVGSISKSADCE
jgi:hypothetical protein